MNKIFILKKNQGFTLIELILMLTIFAIVMAVGAVVLIQIFDIIPSSNERMSTRQLAEIDLNKIIAYVREAKEVNTGENPSIIINEDGTDKTLTFNKNDNKIKMGNETIINNIESFILKKASDSENLFIVTLKKCNPENCNDLVTIETKALKRNINTN